MSPNQNQTAVARGPSHWHFVITVDFTVKPEHFESFMSLLNENAAASVRDEPGCLRFDVMTPADGTAGRVFLYEIYASKQSFDAHLKTTHFLAFDKATASMIASKSVSLYNVTENTKILA